MLTLIMLQNGLLQLLTINKFALMISRCHYSPISFLEHVILSQSFCNIEGQLGVLGKTIVSNAHQLLIILAKILLPKAYLGYLLQQVFLCVRLPTVIDLHILVRLRPLPYHPLDQRVQSLNT